MASDSGGPVDPHETTAKPREINSKGIVYRDPFKEIEKLEAVFDGFTKEYYVSDFGPKAALVAVKNDSILMVRQYRLLINGLSYEIPGGAVEELEAPVDAARRECLEETGQDCRHLKPLLNFDPDLDYTRNHTHVFYSHCIEDRGTRNPASFEWVPRGACRSMIDEGIITDSLTLLALFAYEIRVERAI